MKLNGKFSGIIFGIVIVASLGVNVIQAYMHNQDTKKISFLEDKTKVAFRLY